MRPVVVGCFVNEGRILFVYKSKHDLWQLPQGGVKNKEKMPDAFVREMGEELGEDFVKKALEPQFFGEDQLEFPPYLHGSRKLQADDGNEIEMIGKAYLFCQAQTSETDLDITKSEFDDYKWIPIDEARSFAEENIYQKGKQRMTLKVIDGLA